MKSCPKTVFTKSVQEFKKNAKNKRCPLELQATSLVHLALFHEPKKDTIIARVMNLCLMLTANTAPTMSYVNSVISSC